MKKIDVKYFLTRLALLVAFPVLIFIICFIAMELTPPSPHPSMPMGLIIFPFLGLMLATGLLAVEAIWLQIKKRDVTKRNADLLLVILVSLFTLLFIL